jgi:hypothetical protein
MQSRRRSELLRYAGFVSTGFSAPARRNVKCTNGIRTAALDIASVLDHNFLDPILVVHFRIAASG